MAKLDSTKYTNVINNTAFDVVLDADVIKAWRDDVKDVVDANSPEGQYAADAGASDAYAITLSPAPSAYFTGMVVRFKANTANTGAATLNVNSLGAKTIKIEYDQDLTTGDILANQIVTVIYDGTNFQMLSQSSNRVKRSGDTMTGQLTVTGQSSGGMTVDRPTSGSNALYLAKTSNASVYFGHGDSGYFAIGNTTDIRSTGSGKFRVEAATGLITLANGTTHGEVIGSPEGAVTAPVGSTRYRTDGGASTTLYVKESGTGNTGWKAVTTA